MFDVWPPEGWNEMTGEEQHAAAIAHNADTVPATPNTDDLKSHIEAAVSKLKDDLFAELKDHFSKESDADTTPSTTPSTTTGTNVNVPAAPATPNP